MLHQFTGEYSETNWTFYGAQYPPAALYPPTNVMSDVGVCMSFVSSAVPGWAGASTLATNRFDTNGVPYANSITVYPFGGYDWNLLVTTTNNVPLYEAELGDADMVVIPISGGVLRYATNWTRLTVSVPAMTNPVVKIIIRSPWQGHTFYGGWPFGYYQPNNGGVLGGVTWDAVIPPAPPGPLDPPPPGVLGISRWTNGVSVVFWSLTNPPVTIKRAFDPAGTFETFDYVATTNVFGTNVVGAFVASTNVTGFYRLYSN